MKGTKSNLQKKLYKIKWDRQQCLESPVHSLPWGNQQPFDFRSRKEKVLEFFAILFFLWESLIGRHTVNYWVVKVFKCFLAREHFANWVISRKDFLFFPATLEIWEFQNQIYFNFPFKLITTATNIDQLLQNPKCFSPFIIFLLSLLKTAQGDMLPINCVPTLVEGEQPFLKVSGSEFVHL